MANSFPKHTSATDGWHPRQFSHLSQGGQDALGDLFRVIEVVGDVCMDHPKLLIRLVPKPGSLDSRPIGLYKRLFR